MGLQIHDFPADRAGVGGDLRNTLLRVYHRARTSPAFLSVLVETLDVFKAAVDELVAAQAQREVPEEGAPENTTENTPEVQTDEDTKPAPRRRRSRK